MVLTSAQKTLDAFAIAEICFGCGKTHRWSESSWMFCFTLRYFESFYSESDSDRSSISSWIESFQSKLQPLRLRRVRFTFLKSCNRICVVSERPFAYCFKANCGIRYLNQVMIEGKGWEHNLLSVPVGFGSHQPLDDTVSRRCQFTLLPRPGQDVTNVLMAVLSHAAVQGLSKQVPAHTVTAFHSWRMGEWNHN